MTVPADATVRTRGLSYFMVYHLLVSKLQVNRKRSTNAPVRGVQSVLD